MHFRILRSVMKSINPETFRRSTSGNVAIFFALGSVTFLGLAAICVDGGVLYYTKTRLQIATDAAALGAAKKLPNTSDANALGLSLASLNVPGGFGTVATSADVEPGTYTASTKTFVSTSTNPNAVKVSAHRVSSRGNAVPLAFAGIFGQSAADVSASSVGVHGFANACVYALDPSAAGALQLKGSSITTVQNCGIQVDSNNSQALNVSNNATLTAKSICVVGGASGSTSPAATTGCQSKSDPLSDLPVPTPSTCITSTSATWVAGTYCGNTTISDATLNAGVYYVKGGSLSFKGTVTGNGVIFYLEKDSSFNVTSGANINLTGPTSGTYKGIIFFQARDTPISVTDTINGGGILSIDGAIYVPSAGLQLAGSTGTANVGFIVANTLTTVGSTAFQIMSNSGVVAEVFAKSYLVQ